MHNMMYGLILLLSTGAKIPPTLVSSDATQALWVMQRRLCERRNACFAGDATHALWVTQRMLCGCRNACFVGDATTQGLHPWLSSGAPTGRIRVPDLIRAVGPPDDSPGRNPGRGRNPGGCVILAGVKLWAGERPPQKQQALPTIADRAFHFSLLAVSYRR